VTSRIAVALVFLAVAAGSAPAQQQVTPPLAEVARQAEAARATTRKAKKTYTNSDLGKDPRGEPATTSAPASGFVSKTLGKAVPAEEMVSRSDAKAESEEIAKESEETWRMRAGAVRMQVDRLRERLIELATPNSLRDGSSTLKAANDNEIANVRTALVSVRKQWARLEAAALEVKIPIAWVEPQPVFPQ
jgi:hypothetical protein